MSGLIRILEWVYSCIKLLRLLILLENGTKLPINSFKGITNGEQKNLGRQQNGTKLRINSFQGISYGDQKILENHFLSGTVCLNMKKGWKNELDLRPWFLASVDLFGHGVYGQQNHKTPNWQKNSKIREKNPKLKNMDFEPPAIWLLGTSEWRQIIANSPN